MNLLKNVTVNTPLIERQLAAYHARKISSVRSYKSIKKNYHGKIKASRKPYSTFILFEFDDGSSDFVSAIDAQEFCKKTGIKNPDKFLDYVQNYYTASIDI